MPILNLEYEKFNLKQASECAESFCVCTNLGTTISGFDGKNYYSCGNGCNSCTMKDFITDYSKNDVNCVNTHMYGMMQAERFGGKYIYFCPAGFNFIVSPILAEEGPVAYVKAGPFLMVEKDDYIKYDLCDLLKIPLDYYKTIEKMIEHIPYINPDRITKFSNLLYMSIGFLNNINLSNEMIKKHDTQLLQGEISEILFALKTNSNDRAFSYPFETELALINAIKDSNKANANKYLNDLLGIVFFYTGGDLEVIRARIFELLVLMSRAAIEGGADSAHIFNLNSKYFTEIYLHKNLDSLCIWLSDVMNKFTDYVFRFNDVKHVEVIRKAVDYIRQNYSKRITLEEVSSYVYLSPSYFSKIFKDEIGQNFNSYLNKIRIEKSKQFLLSDKVRLIDVSGMVGFEDQSYFSKVFKKLTGVTPGKFRESRGKLM